MGAAGTSPVAPAAGPGRMASNPDLLNLQLRQDLDELEVELMEAQAALGAKAEAAAPGKGKRKAGSQQILWDRLPRA